MDAVVVEKAVEEWRFAKVDHFALVNIQLDFLKFEEVETRTQARHSLRRALAEKVKNAAGVYGVCTHKQIPIKVSMHS